MWCEDRAWGVERAGALRGGESEPQSGRAHALERGEAEWLSASATAQHRSSTGQGSVRWAREGIRSISHMYCHPSRAE